MAIRIKIQDGNRVLVAKIDRRPISIGRSRECDITIEDSQCSKVHCFIYILDGRVVVKDNKSKNGTFVNAFQVEDKYYLTVKEKLIIGNTIISLDSRSLNVLEFMKNRGRYGGFQEISKSVTIQAY